MTLNIIPSTCRKYLCAIENMWLNFFWMLQKTIVVTTAGGLSDPTSNYTIIVASSGLPYIYSKIWSHCTRKAPQHVYYWLFKRLKAVQ